ncbi:MAG: GNAT family N-acetyltransferase [Muribaculum sp.]|nr:GNAT family N-acetyltransferase [Muribaculaceae bacterium]MCM1080966.1 GNAT family N-acetyltransferase [Muribaculum sp.]
MNSILSNNRITFRALEPNDVDLLMSWENDSTQWPIGNTVAPFSRKALWDYIENYNPDIYQTQQLRLMIVDNGTGRAVGMVDLYDFDAHNRRCGVGILIGKEFRHCGYGMSTLEAIRDYVRNFLGLHQLWALIPTDNQHSLELFTKSGFKICGRLRSWLRRNNTYVDVYVLQALK